MPRRRTKPGPEALILPAVLILFGLSQAIPGAIEGLFGFLTKLLLFLAFSGVAWFFYSSLIDKPKPTATGDRTKSTNKVRIDPPFDWSEKSKPSSSTTSRPAANTNQPNPQSLTWSLALLQELEWKRFEQLCEAYFRAKQLDARMTGVGADGGVDICLYKHNSDQPFALMQCKAWSGRVGVKPVRELYGVMAAAEVKRGIFLCSGGYTDDAKKFCEGKPLRLMSGENLLNAILKLDYDEQKNLLKIATKGDYRTPTCPNCDIKLIDRKGPKGSFWGCQHYPRCRYTAPMKKLKKKLKKKQFDYSYLSNA